MRLLLDTHVFLWMADDRERLSPQVAAAIRSPDNDLFLSVASVWELQIKAGLGKLDFGSSLPEAIARQRRENRLRLLAVISPDVFALQQLPDIHRDPFDRLLVATARARGLTLVTCDPQIAKYQVPTLW